MKAKQKICVQSALSEWQLSKHSRKLYKQQPQIGTLSQQQLSKHSRELYKLQPQIGGNFLRHSRNCRNSNLK